MNKAQQKILDTIEKTGKAYVAWEEVRLARSRCGELIRIKGVRKQEAVQKLIQDGTVVVVEEEVHHHFTARNAKYATTGRYVVVRKA